MKSRLINNYTTTIIGVVFIGAGLYMQIEKYEEASWAQAYFVGLLFLRAKDSLIGLDKKDEA
jgi:hypothetical protein